MGARLAELHGAWREAHHPSLSKKSRYLSDGVWTKHLEPRLGDVMIRDIGPREVEQLAAALARDGVGEASIEKVLLQLGQMMRRAASWGWVNRDPVSLAHRPRKKPRRRVRPPELVDVELVRAELTTRDATFVSIGYLAGLRPGEIMGLRWGDVSDTHLHVERAISMNEIVRPKAASERSVRIGNVLREDLDAWHEWCANPFSRLGVGDVAYVFGGPRHWGEVEYRAWRHSLKKAGERVGVEWFHPYSLRHLRASLLIKSGTNVIEAAGQMGHAATMLLSTYGHVLQEFEGQPPIDIDNEVRRARMSARLKRSGLQAVQEAPGKLQGASES